MREKVAIAPENLVSALVAAGNDLSVEGVTILSTCNRTEIYLDATNLQSADVLDWLAKWHQLGSDQLRESTYEYSGEAAASHLMRVAAGLDSMVLGEPQILGQLKSAYAVAEKAGTLSSALHQVFQHSFASAKRVRSETAIGQNPVSVAYAAVSLARQIFADLANKTVLLIGAGETIALVGRHLKDQGIGRVLIANRTAERADDLAESLGAESILLSDIPSLLHEADVVFSSTASQLPLLGKGAVESALRQRKHRMMFMVDLAVPRDIEIEVGELEDVYLYTVDDLSEVIEENRRSREQAAEEAEALIREELIRWKNEALASDHSGLIRGFRSSADQVRQQELEKAISMLESGQRVEEVMTRFAHNLTQKLIHDPTAQLKRVIQSGDSDEINLARRLFSIEETEAKDSGSDSDQLIDKEDS